MDDRPGSPSRVRMSEDKVRRKDLCWSVRAVYILEKLPDVSGPGLGEAGRYNSSMGICMKNIYMEQPKGFVVEEKERMGCHM